MNIEPIAYFHSPFHSKFGIPKQSGLVEELEGSIVFCPEYRNADALRGLDEFDYLWLIWGFSANKHAATSLVVRPPLLGGNEKMGVFATRSPFRPNALGLSSVRISRIETDTTRGPVITVVGADLMDGTPIYDIKPYIPYADSHPEAKGGFTDTHAICRLTVVIPDCFHHLFSQSQLQALYKVLELDPRPHYHKSGQKEYGMPYMDYDVHFTVNDGVLTVTDVIK
ncbi:tRNA (N6-threonylcarbamoyladenosine(37)-N6)-methyltransferase TrmO [Prevotella sp. P5-108]|jgi:tRNA-Thr(GGU) m(6)t(6)A37 methyltransferase TsaA|uniref:tRNA (N6-threonylcarbamoyladenosine(37)-N6)-methyltransferase TrmO n=1 Tax=Prevotella sp. P5-108 TaxID=2024225 RepID=UPI000B9621AE|nr:tRNA (N6-threonylcarbamoyladenosine(37)-N6)-methyltransferase TrmO [Prevotella sp. P5-108]OYP63755.1 tRNA (N6-threonylcarbamoyladenosine(37)-N6)-methyltransferase TrmO [Prevotella sp. P5-108]